MMKLMALATPMLLSILTGEVVGEQTIVTKDPTQTDWEPSMLGFDDFSTLVMNLDGEKSELHSAKPWFIKFYAPWCGHCQRLAPTWSEFNRMHQDDINVGLVDCTTEEGQPLCSRMEVRGYPTILFFPGKGDVAEGERPQAYKFQGPRNLESLEDFALKGGWKLANEEATIPMNLKGVESWARWFAQQKVGIMRDIDMAWRNYGLEAYVPPPFHYWLVTIVCSMPFILIITLLCCLTDEDEFDKPQYAQKNPEGAQNQTSANASSPKKKSASRAEKLD